MKHVVKVMHGTDFEVDEQIEPCKCGEYPSFEICYGRTPFSIHCSSCRTHYSNDITNCSVHGAIRYWNIWRKNEGDNEYNLKGSPY